MNEEIVEIINAQSSQLFRNTEFIFEYVDDRLLSKGELFEYYLKIKTKLQGYLTTLTVADLSLRPEGCTFSKLDLLLGQFKHIMFHIGMIHGCILMENGEIPDYVGLSDPIKPSDNS